MQRIFVPERCPPNATQRNPTHSGAILLVPHSRHLPASEFLSSLGHQVCSIYLSPLSISLCPPLTVVHTHVARRSSPVHMLITVSFGISACLCTRAFSLPHCSFAISLPHCCSSLSPLLLHALRYVRMRSFYLILLR